jgi:hypothetical protein
MVWTVSTITSPMFDPSKSLAHYSNSTMFGPPAQRQSPHSSPPPVSTMMTRGEGALSRATRRLWVSTNTWLETTGLQRERSSPFIAECAVGVQSARENPPGFGQRLYRTQPSPRGLTKNCCDQPADTTCSRSDMIAVWTREQASG